MRPKSANTIDQLRYLAEFGGPGLHRYLRSIHDFWSKTGYLTQKQQDRIDDMFNGLLMSPARNAESHAISPTAQV